MVAVRRRRGQQPEEPAFTLEESKALSDTRNEPQWLRDFRIECWRVYESLGMPTLQDEEWRRTDYRSIRWDQAGIITAANGAGIDSVPHERLEPLVGDGEGGSIVFVDGKLVRHEFSDKLKSAGVIFSDLHSAAAAHEDLVSANLMQKAVVATDGKFAALHGAMWTHGVFVYVPRGVLVDLPLHVVMYNTKAGASLGHVLVVLEENAQATIQVEYGSSDADVQSAYIGATELILGPASNLRYVALQDWNRNTYEFSHQRARLEKDANLDWITGSMGSRLTKAFLEIDIDGPGANGRMSGFFFADKDQLFDLDTQQNHNAPLTTSDLLFKGAAKDDARTVWQGMIKSLPKMQKIDGFQACRNLMLSEKARMDSIPGLEIEADDVMCSHAATFGTLEEEPIFYLMSRGIPRPDAQLMVIDGFFDELLQRVPFDRVRDRLKTAIEAKILS